MVIFDDQIWHQWLMPVILATQKAEMVQEIGLTWV
jgi:hypothetical protein